MNCRKPRLFTQAKIDTAYKWWFEYQMNNLSIYCEKKYILFEIKDGTKLRDWGMTGQRMEVRCLLKKKSIIICEHKVYKLYTVYLTSSHIYSRAESRQTDWIYGNIEQKMFCHNNIFFSKVMGEQYSIISKSIWDKEIPSSDRLGTQ